MDYKQFMREESKEPQHKKPSAGKGMKLKDAAKKIKKNTASGQKSFDPRFLD